MVSLKGTPGAKQTYYIHYQIMTDMRSGSSPDSKEEVKAMVGSTGMYYVSKTISMYSDAEEIYTVVHPQKKIIRSRADKKIDPNLRRQQGALLQDSLIDNATILPCQQGTYHEKKVTVINLLPNAMAVKKLKIDKITYYLNETNQTMEGQEIFYSKASAIQKREIRFHALDFDYKGNIKSKAKDYLFDGDKLKSSFKGYTFEDNTKE